MQAIARVDPAIVPVHSDAKAYTMDPEMNGYTHLQYPLKMVKCGTPVKYKYNIIYFILESWRSDTMNERVTPVIYDLAQKSYVFTNHISGGTVTPTGLFSIMYGLHPTYMRYVAADPAGNPPVMIRVMRENGYAIGAYTSSNFDGFSLKTMFFNGIAAKDFVQKLDEGSVKDDRYVISRVVESIGHEHKGSPFFKFVFLTSSHHGYKYPKSHAIFHPVAREGSFLFNKYADPAPLLNKYKNSLHYNDALFGEVLSALRKAGLDSKTIIVVTSDHGEEFNDKGYGYWGHGSNFTRYQTSVPLILFLPDNAEGHVISRRSSHCDIAPTLLKYLFGCNDFSSYSSGRDLLDLPDHRGLIVQSYMNKAFIIDNIVYSEGFTLDSYDINDIGKKNDQFDYKALELLKESERTFLK